LLLHLHRRDKILKAIHTFRAKQQKEQKMVVKNVVLQKQRPAMHASARMHMRACALSDHWTVATIMVA